MLTGVVTRFNEDKGWGFVKADTGGPDVMVHVKELLPGEDAAWLKQGVRVGYDERSGPKGLRAANVQILAEDTEQRTDLGDVLTAAQFRDEVSTILADAVSQMEKTARRHGWIWLGMYSDDQVAWVCHDANRALQYVQGDPAPSQPWDCELPEIRESAIAGVRAAKRGCMSRELHDSWVKVKREQGWVYGPVKDSERKTHPCMVPYDQLPQAQRDKDRLFRMIVRALTDSVP